MGLLPPSYRDFLHDTQVLGDDADRAHTLLGHNTPASHRRGFLLSPRRVVHGGDGERASHGGGARRRRSGGATGED